MAGTIIFRFDDAKLSTWDYAMPILAARGLAGSVFAMGYFMPQMSLRQLHEMYDAGWDVANHTDNHYDLTTLSESAATAEIAGQSAWLLENGFTRSARFLAYPNNGYNATVRAAAAAAGILAATGSAYGYNSLPVADWLQLTHQYLGATYSLATIEGYIDTAVAADDALIIVGHDLVASGATGMDWLPSDFASLVDYAVASGAAVVPLSQFYAGQTGTPWSYGGKPPSRGASASSTAFGPRR